MNVQLVECWTADGVRLNGALAKAESGRGTVPSSVDGLVLVSGVGSSFYSSTLMAELASHFFRLGVTVLRVNTRGHDIITTVQTRQGGRLAGAAYEVVDDCRWDIPAWAAFLTSQGCQRIGLLGHSLGALKVLYSQAREAHAGVCRVVALSPPRLAHDAFLEGPQSAPFRTSLRTATELVDSQQPGQLFEATFPFPLIMSAATYLDKYGPQSRYDLLKYAADVTVPVCFTFGEEELESGNIAFAGLDERIRGLNWNRMPVVHTIPGANHFYSGAVAPVCQAVEAFLCSE